jgi:hypothetical protein
MKILAKKSSRLALIISLVALTELQWAPIISGQTAGTGAVMGTVTDPSGAVVPQALVTIVSLAQGTARTVETDATGVYRVLLVPPGKYSIEITAKGFKTERRSEVDLHVTETLTVNAALEVGASTQSVTVQAETSLVQSETTNLGTLVDQTEVTNLPLSTRNYTQILGLSPGVTASLTNASTLGRNTQLVFVNGMRAFDNNYQMDGNPVNNIASGIAADAGGQTGIAVPSPDAIQEFQVQTGLYDAGYGRSIGANVNVVTKSGTNQYHGTAFEFFRNEVLNANDFFLNRTGQSRPIFRQNLFGGTFGGPILRDKLVFFTAYQGTRQTNGQGPSSLQSSVMPPLTADRSAATLGSQFCGQRGTRGGVAVACNGSNINPVALAFLNLKRPNGQFLIPSPQVIQPNGQGLFVTSVPSLFTEDQFIINVDYHLTRKNTLSGRWFYSRDPETLGFTVSTLPGAGATSAFGNRTFLLKLSSVITPTFLNEVSASYTRNLGTVQSSDTITTTQVGMTPATTNGSKIIPQITASGFFSFGGGVNDNVKNAVTTFRFADQISWSKARHSVRAGFEFLPSQNNVSSTGFNRGHITMLSFADFLLGMSAAQNGSQFSNVFTSLSYNGISDRQFRLHDYALFVQDDFKIYPRLTLNLGLRWEINGGVSEKRGIYSNFWPNLASNIFPPGGTLTGAVVPNNFKGGTGSLPAGVVTTGNNTCCVTAVPLKNFGPRIGLAWRPLARTDRFVVRAGYGIFYSRVSTEGAFQTTVGPPFVQLRNNSGVSNALATFQVPYNPAPAPLSAYPIFVPRTATSALSIELVDPNYSTPMVQQYALNIEYQFSNNYLLQMGYVGTHGTHVQRLIEYNEALLASPQNPINGITTNTVANARQRVPILGMDSGGLLDVTNNGDILYNSLQTSLIKRFSFGVQFQVGYTFSKTLDNVVGSNSVANSAGTLLSGSSSNDIHDNRQVWGPADFDRRHHFVFSGIWDLPGFRNGKGLAGRLLSGWSMSDITIFQSGNPLTIYDSNAGTIYGQNSLQSFSPRAQMCPGATYANAATSGSVTDRLNHYINLAAFCAPPKIGDGTGFGNSGRGLITGPGQANFDISITKKIPITESKSFEFRSEFFNAFNHAQFANPATNVATPASFGIITATSVAPRIVQFALKYIF